MSNRKGKEVVIVKKAKKGLMDLNMYQESYKQQGKKEVKLRQTNINNAYDKEIRARAIQHIARLRWNSH